MDVRDKLEEKTLQIQQELEQWVKETDLLEPGQRLVFSPLRLKTVPLVGLESEFQPASKKWNRSKLPLLGPVELSESLATELLNIFVASEAKNELARLLRNENAPVNISNATRMKINQVLRDVPIQGQIFYLVWGTNALSQLWVTRD